MGGEKVPLSQNSFTPAPSIDSDNSLNEKCTQSYHWSKAVLVGISTDDAKIKCTNFEHPEQGKKFFLKEKDTQY